MNKKKILKILIHINIVLILIVALYKGYLSVYESNFESININSINRIENKNKDSNNISFAVAGNINNSIDIFDKQIVKNINDDKSIDFVISTGNAVLDGAEDKYRIINKSLKKLNVPFVDCFGENELSDGGDVRFYKHFGPYYFSYSLNDSVFIFLDTTVKTSKEWQKKWLVNELDNAKEYKYKFVVMNKPPFKIEENSMIIGNSDSYIKDKDYSEFLINTFSKYQVTAVFASSVNTYENKIIKNVNYFITGGAGGFILNSPENFYHYIKVTFSSSGVKYLVVKQELSRNSFYRITENIWIFIHSIFYTNWISLLFILSIILAIGIFIYSLAFVEKNFYRDFNAENTENYNEKKLCIAIFTNNYFPFVGGVPISIKRTVNSLRDNGHDVYIFAPDYGMNRAKIIIEEKNIYRFKAIFHYKNNNLNFPIVNAFLPEIEKQFIKHKFDIIHVQHPFWMGKKGLKLGLKYNIPVVLTYHTKFEDYAHLLPFFRNLFKNTISHKLIKRFAQNCTSIIAPTNTVSEYLRNIGVSRYIDVIQTGVDLDVYQNVKEDELNELINMNKANNEIVLCSVLRLSKEKNIDFLIDGIKYIKEHTRVPFKCLIVGDGPEKSRIYEKIKQYKLTTEVELVGLVKPKEVSKYYIASDIFVFSSKSETQGMVILEAMAGGCPTVAIRSSGIDDLIENNFNGYKTKDDIKDWSEKLIYLMKNKLVLDKLGENAYKFSKNYSKEEIVKRIISIYKKSIENYNDFEFLNGKN
ncbi:glycosyltransferase [Helicovermis profundi]|uniref:Glycosyltransferase n=1 Tax=Helicovermis profundi TaxID=3065157 RepID=A0AAU9E8X2_9FIRM|nr:hypothetical protein HLPR_05580 [Clostridia bacterium S502]